MGSPFLHHFLEFSRLRSELIKHRVLLLVLLGQNKGERTVHPRWEHKEVLECLEVKMEATALSPSQQDRLQGALNFSRALTHSNY